MSGRGFLDLRSPVMRPVWVRIVMTAICLGWASVEAAWGHAGWALLFGVAGAWLVWALVVVWDPAALDDDAGETGDGK